MRPADREAAFALSLEAMMKRGAIALLLLSSIAGFQTSPVRATPYGFATIDEPLAFPGFTEASGINDAGQIVGTFLDTSIVQHGFLLSGGSFTTIDAPFGPTAAAGINAAGDIVGFSGAHGFLKTGASFSSVDFPGGTSTEAAGINDAGDIVGRYQDAASHTHGFLKSGASFATIDDPNAIAADGGSFATGINSAGAIVGSYFDATGHHGFLKIGASFITIDDPNVNSGQTFANGINNLGEIVGSYFDGTADHIFVDDGGVFTTIDDPAGVVVGTISANGINAAGEIVGSYADETAGDHGFLATPVSVPEPATSILLVSGLLGLAASRSRPRHGRGDGLRSPRTPTT
jgi:probable HAF family extracellular repeat protein